MYSGLLPKGVTEDELSPEEEAEEEAASGSAAAENSGPEAAAASTVTAGGPDTRSPNTQTRDNRSPDTQTRDTRSPDTQTPDTRSPDTQIPSCSLPGVSHHLWQRFQDLRRKKDEIKDMKIPRKRKRRRHKKGPEIEEPTEKREHQDEREKHWDGLKEYFGVNDRFQPPACSRPLPKSGLEKSIERAIAEGDIAKAEEMSDRLATREMAVKIAQAADCRDFVQRKQEEEALRAAQKRKKQIAWGFEAKQRWETKSNMGFM